MTRDFGRHAYGAAAIIYGALALHWNDVNTWPQLAALAKAPYHEPVVYIVAAILIVGGLAIQWRRTAQLGAVVLGAFYLVVAVLCIPGIVAAPLIYNNWGNFFEQFSIASGALIAYASLAPGRLASTARAARHIFWYLRCLVCARAGILFERHGRLRSKVDPARANVLGNRYHDCLRTRRHRHSVGASSSSGLSTPHGNVRAFRITGMASGASRKSAQSLQLGRKHRKPGDRRSRVDPRRLPAQRSGSAQASTRTGSHRSSRMIQSHRLRG